MIYVFVITKNLQINDIYTMNIIENKIKEEREIER